MSNLHLRWVPRNARGVLLAEDTAAGILVPLRRHIRAAGAPTAALLFLECHSTGGVAGISNLLMSTYEQTAAPDPLYRDSAVLTIDSHPSNEGTLRQIMSKVIKALPFESITHLDLRLATHLTQTSCRAILPAFNMVYIMSNKGTENFIRALLEVELADPRRETYSRIRCLHLLAAVWDKEDDTLTAILGLLKAFLGLWHTNGNPLQVFEIDERHRCLSAHEERIEQLFPLIGDSMIRNGTAYNPIKQKEERAKRMAEWRAQAVELGLGDERLVQPYNLLYLNTIIRYFKARSEESSANGFPVFS
ncbi:hypothetical protein C8R44DRAFT_732917 [Mycena epipterygia]|nr:hypothetical protein C8R44DRAFT_732917 [Mycena epipterygia]